jgi:acyl-CoA reductase-like NAD-dependent aldehyde dehydrogenase
MAVRLTYTSGGIDSATHAEFERRLREARAAAPEPWPHVIAGEPRHEGAVFKRADPSHIDRVASRAHAAEPQTVALAVQAARAATPQWRRTPYRERLEHLAAVARAISERHLELAAVMSLETGKSRTEAIVEVQEAIELIETYSEEMERHDGFVAPLASFTPAERGTEILRPYGVIAPFNFPLALTVGMAAAALLAEALLAGELPAGVFNLLHGGPDTGRALVAAPVDGIAFTGSAEIVLDGVHDELLERLGAFTATLPVGDPSEREAFLGPVVNARAFQRFHEAVETAAARGGSRSETAFRARRTGSWSPPSSTTSRADIRSHAKSSSCHSSPSHGSPPWRRRSPRPTPPTTASPPGSSAPSSRRSSGFLDELQAGVLYVNRRAGATTGAWSFCGWKSSGTTGKGGLGPYYLPQFMREQSRTVVS